MRHYADCNGRANREEYWMYVSFYIIFSIVWVMLIGIIFAIFNLHPGGIMRASMMYTFLLALPGLAVSVRRLHDTGHSGWMLLLTLIPVAGAIWMLVLMVSKGQEEANQYGPNPGSSPETFSERRKLKSAGVAFIVATFAVIVSICLHHLFVFRTGGYIFTDYSFYVQHLLMLATGIYLYRSRSIQEVTGNTRKAMLLLLATQAFVVLGYIKSGMTLGIRTYTLLSILMMVSLIVFALLNLYASLHKSLIRIASIAVVVFATLTPLWQYFAIRSHSELKNMADLFAGIGVMVYAAYIVLAITFYPSEKETAADTTAE